MRGLRPDVPGPTLAAPQSGRTKSFIGRFVTGDIGWLAIHVTLWPCGLVSKSSRGNAG
jgi:hypothetical protein